MCEWGHHSRRATKRPWGCGGVPAGRYDTRVLRHPAPGPINAWCPLLPRLSGGCSTGFLWGLHSWAQCWHYEGWVTLSSFLIWFWKGSMRDYRSPIQVLSHQQTSPGGGRAFARLALCSNWIKPPEGGRQLWFYGQEKPHMWKLQCMLKEIIVETRCLKSHLCW